MGYKRLFIILIFVHSAIKICNALCIAEFYLFFLAKKEECELWVTGIRYLAEESTKAPYPLLVERYLRKEFYSMENLRGVWV